MKNSMTACFSTLCRMLCLCVALLCFSPLALSDSDSQTLSSEFTSDLVLTEEHLISKSEVDFSQVSNVLQSYKQYPFLSDNVLLWFLLTLLLSVLSILLTYSLFLYVQKSKDKEQKLTYVSYHDALTGVHNRVGLLKFLNLTSAFNRELKFAAVVFDIKDFKYMNYAYSEEFGDKLLVQVGKEFKKIFTGSNVIARLGANEFCVIDFNSKDLVERESVVRQVKQHFESGILVEGRAVSIRFNTGVSLYPNDTMDMSLLLQYGHVAMLRSKDSSSKGFEYYHADMAVSTYRRIQLLRRLEDAVLPESESLNLVYQPIVTAGGGLFKAEALLRWNDSVLGFVPPDEFIAVAEETSIISDINHWVINSAVSQMRLWMDSGVDSVIAINISRFDLFHDQVLTSLTNAVAKYQVDPSQLIVEIRESTVFENMKNDTILESMKVLKKLGYLIAIDDFGTGFSNFSYLNELPIDIVKIDKSLVDHIGEDDKHHSICEAIYSLCNVMDKKCVVEGVEDALQFDLTQKMGVDYFQGYHFSKPLLPIDVVDFWENDQSNYDTELHKGSA